MKECENSSSPRLLAEVESKQFLVAAGIPVVEARLARSKKEAIAISKDIGFPVVFKINSADVAHKSDVGGVKLGLYNVNQAGKAYSEIMSSVRGKYPRASIQGISVQKMVPPGVEVIVGMNQDPQFGPVLMFGLGGIMVEVLKDVSFRVVPVTQKDAAEMIREIKGYPVLQGYRGRAAVDISALEDMIIKISQFVEKNPQVKELDLNPVFAYEDRAVAVDARVILAE
jgi:acetate---CoA ligase (ADP-forming) subunit beta